MIPQIKKILKKAVPKPIFNSIYVLYRHSFFYIVHLVRHLYVTVAFRTPKLITIKGTHLKIVINPINGYTDKNLFLFKERDTDLVALMESRIKHGDIIVDIGANIGYETVWGAHFVGPSGHVYSFEPIKHLAEQILLSLQENKFENVTLITKAAGARPGTATIYTHSEDAGLTSIENKDGATKETIIPVTTIDAELASVQKISFFKIDVEGYELETLQGARRTLERDHPLIVFEFTPSLYEKNYKGKSKDLLMYLIDMGYNIKIMSTDNLLNKKSGLNELIDSLVRENRMVNMIAEFKP